MKVTSKALMSVVLGGLSLLAPAAKAGEADEQALAERLSALADRFGNTASAAPYRESLFDASCRLSDREVRYFRNRLRAAEMMADAEVMLATLQGWRKLEPQNLFVQMELIDVYVMRLQTADGRLNYLKPIIDAESVSAEVRSHAACQMARLYLEQSRVQQAMEMLHKSVMLNGLNTDALTMEWQLGLNGSTPVQRIALLLSMLKADPASVEAVLLIAGELANANMVQQSLQWYGHAASMSRPIGGLVGGPAKDYAAELLIAGQDREAAQITSKMLEKDGADPGAWFLTLLAERDKKDRIELVRKSALIGLLNRVAMARQAMGAKDATTRPLGSDEVTLPDLAGDGELLKKATPLQVKDYAAAVSDVAWFIVSQQPNVSDATVVIKALQAADAGDKEIARLEGWQLLRNGKLEEARAKLVALADRDPFAAVGMVRILRQEPATMTQATDMARRLIRQYPAGYVGAVVRSEVGELAGEVPADPMTEAIRDQLDRFPKEILKLVSSPQDFLTMRLQPQQVGHDYAEPILMEVELRNLQEVPLVVGPSGMARDLWLDVQTRGLTQQWVSGVCFDKIDGPVILQPGATIRWITRLDRGPLAEVLERNVQQAEQMSVFGLTNAVPTEQGVVPGPCGIRGRMTQMVERRASSLVGDVTMRKPRATIDGTDAVAKMRLADQVTAYLKIVADPDGPPNVKAMGAEPFQDLLIRLGQDSSVPVRAWARYRMAQLGVEQPEKTSTDLAKEQAWYARMLAALCAMDTPVTTRTTLLQTLSKDPDATVRLLVDAIPQAMNKPTTKEIPAK